jgi:hypothetical protein
MTEDKYIEFVMKTIENYKKYSDRLISDENEIFPQDLQFVLANYQSVKFGLLLELSRRNREFNLAKRSFDSWWNSKLLEAKQKLTGDSKKFAAVKDYTIQAAEDSKEEYDQKKNELQDLEEKYEFLKLLRSDWDSFMFVLQMLNKNMTSELQSLRTDRDFSQDIRPIRMPRT